MSKGKKLFRLVGGALVIAALAWFAHANSGRYVDLRFGLFTLRAVSLPVVVYGSVILGMLLVVGASWRNDLRARQALKKYDQIASNVMSDLEPTSRELEEANRKT
jgi:uncharacterized integral membrane protein